jgi:vanillate/3-O-methylgallate O-demethylase
MDGRPQRKKVTFEWNPDDVVRVWRSIFEPEGENFKYLDLPLSNYTSATYDAVLRDGKVVGFSMFGGFTVNDRAFLSLGTVDPDVEIGDELTLVWGEEGGGTRKTTVERHKQTEIQVRVAPTPYSPDARQAYGGQWRGGS